MTSGTSPGDLEDLRFVGPATAAVLEDRGIDPVDVVERRVSHAQLLEAGVNAGVAAKIRREHSLAWSLDGGEDLDRRAEQVRGLKDEERAWVAASSEGWSAESTETGRENGAGAGDEGEAAWQDHSWPGTDDDAGEQTAETAWREASAPTPVTDLEPVDAEAASLLAEAGITSVRSLATASPERVADSLDVDVETVRTWHEAARSLE
ncbi:MAG: helix-hairpin-helix domain-containing protein [Halanaeroarchaeum sp.]